MDGHLSTGSAGLLNHDAIIPRLRVMRNTIAPTRSQDAEPAPSLARSSSSSSSVRRRARAKGGSNLAEDFSHVARASTSSSDSAAARLRELTKRVPVIGPPTSASMMPARSSSPEDVYFDTASEAGTIVRPGSGAEQKPKDPHTVPMPADLDSDLDRMAENFFKPHPSRLKSAQEKLHELVASVTSDDEKVMTPPKFRTRTSSFTSPPSQRQALKRVSLSDEEPETSSQRHSGGNRRLRKEHSSTPSLSVLRARLNSASVQNEILNDTPAHPRATHPLYAELESANLSGELPNPTPQHSFSKHPPLRTSTPRSFHDRTASVDSDRSSYTMSPFRAPSALRPPFPLQLRPASPTSPQGPSSQPKFVVGRRRRINLNGTRSATSERTGEITQPGHSEEDENESEDGPNDGEDTQDGLPVSSSSFQSRSKSLMTPEQSFSEPPLATGTTTITFQQRSPRSSSFVPTSKRDRISSSPQLANSHPVVGSPARLTGAQPVPNTSQPAARSSSANNAPVNSRGQLSSDDAVTESETEEEGLVSSKIVGADSNTLEQEKPRSNNEKATRSQSMPKYQAGTFRSEYDTYMKEQRATREQSFPQSDSLREPYLSAGPATPVSFHRREDTSMSGPRPSTPPSPATSIPLPPSPTIGDSPTRQPIFSKDRDLERLRKATTTVITSPRKDHQNKIFQGDETEPHPTTVSAVEFSGPLLSTSKSTPQNAEEDSEPDDPSRIDQGIDALRTPMPFATPPRPHQGIRHKRNQFRATPQPEDLPDLPSPPESPGSPVHTSNTLVARGKTRNSSLDHKFSFPSSSPVNEPRTPRPPGSWTNGVVTPRLPPNPSTPPIETHLEGDEQGILFADAQTPSPPGSSAGPPASDDRSISMVYDSNAQLTDGSIMRTPAPPGGWSSFAAPNVNNSLKKGILKVRFDETSVASWNKLQRVSGDNGEPEPNSFPLGHEKVRKALPGRFLSSPNAEAAQGLSAASSSKPSRRNEWDAGSPSGSVRKRKSRLRMVDEFGNALPDQPATENNEEDEMPLNDSPLQDDDLPATLEEIRGLRRVARAVPHIAKELADDSISPAPAPTSAADQLRTDDRIADLTGLSRAARAERAKLRRKLQSVHNSEDALKHQQGSRSGATTDGAQGSWPRRRRWWITILSIEIILFYFVVRHTASRAEHLFLATHFDPFFPAIYSPPPVPTSSSLSSQLWNLLFSISGPVPPPPPPPPTRIAFGLVPRTIVPQGLLALLDKINSLLSVDVAASFWDGGVYYAGGTWVPS